MPHYETDEFEPGAHTGSVMARLAEPTATTTTRLAVIADPHVGIRSENTSKIFGRTEQHLENAIQDIQQRNVDAVCSVGDLTKDGEPYNYEAVDRLLEDLTVPFFAVPGNHDVPKTRDEHDTLSVAEFADRYAPGGAYPFTTRVGDVDIVGLNTAGTADWLFETHDGAFDPQKREHIRETLAETTDPIVLSHYNLPAMFDQLRAHRDAVEPEMHIPPITRHGTQFAETLAAGGTALLLTGHLHLPATATQAGVREIMVPTTCSFPQAYLTLTIDEAGTTVRFHPVAGRSGLRHAFQKRTTDSTTARGLTAIAADRLARFPLVDQQ